MALKVTVLGIGGIAALSFFTAGLAILRSSKLDYSATRAATRGFKSALSGTVPTYYNGSRDHRASAGLVIDTKTKNIVLNGKISDETVSSILPASLI